MTNELAIASAEINKILGFLPDEDVNKVPVKLRETFEELADENYIAKIDPNKRLIEQDISEKAKDIIALLYRNYWCSSEEKKEIDAILIKNEKEYQKSLREKYNPDDIFKEEKVNKAIEATVDENNTKISEYVVVEKKESLKKYDESIFRKIINKIKQLLSKKINS